MNDPPTELTDFPVQVAIPVQWGDQDVLGHVNAARYLTWFETARVELLRRLGWSKVVAVGTGPILASLTCNYRRPVHFPDTVTIGARVEKLGRTSIHIAHVLYSESQATLVADSTSVVVTFDYDNKCPVPIPQELRQAISNLA